MKKIALLLVVPLLLAADAAWPKKGDVVYVAAALSGFSPGMVMAGGFGAKAPDVPALEPCAPLTVRRHSEEATIARDDNGNDRKLVGDDWAGRLYRSAGECADRMKADGPPRVQGSGGYVYRLAH